MTAVIDATDRLGEVVDELHTAQSTALEARVLAHQINGDLGRIVGGLDLLLADPGLTAEQRAEVTQIREAATAMTGRFVRVHQLIRAINPDPLPGAPS